MKRGFLLLLMALMLLGSFPAMASTSWQDATIPPPGIEESAVLFKIVPDKTDVIRVGQDIPAGLYGIAPFKFENSPVIHYDYMFGIMRGPDVVFESDILNTETHSDLIICLDAGDVLIFTSNGNIAYLHSVDTVMLRPY